MNDSKYDDYKRYLSREVLKFALYLPYNGALAASVRSADYLRFLGLAEDRIHLHYDNLALARVRVAANSTPGEGGITFMDRYFVIVARLVSKKNLFMALEAFALFNSSSNIRRKLYICGSGPLEQELKARAADLAIGDSVIFLGFVPSLEVYSIIARSLALILPSSEEQFGQVVIEAQALGIPVILSENCGARDLLVRSGVNGFVVESDNSAGLAFFMDLVSGDERLWSRLHRSTNELALQGDVSRFAESVNALVEEVMT